MLDPSIPRRSLLLGAAAFGAAGLAACSRRPAAVPASEMLALDAPLPDVTPPGTELAIGDPTTQWVLEHTGVAEHLPFKVRWEHMTGGPEVTEAFNAKALDVGLGASVPPIHAVWVGIPVKVIAFRLRRDPLDHPAYLIGVSPKTHIDSLADLKGKTIAFSPSQVQGEIVLRTLKAQGLTTKDVKLVELPSSIGGDVYTNALASGLVDAAPIGAGVIADRYMRKFGGDGAKTIRHPPFRDDAFNVFVREEVLRDAAKAAALKHYVRAWAWAQNWMTTHRDEWIKGYYVGNQGLTAADGALIVDAGGLPDIPSDWAGAITYQQSVIDVMAAQSGAKPFKAETLFDRRFQRLAADTVAEAHAAGDGPIPV
jgi:sulfonate transport system substrate-binding protein